MTGAGLESSEVIIGGTRVCGSGTPRKEEQEGTGEIREIREGRKEGQVGAHHLANASLR